MNKRQRKKRIKKMTEFVSRYMREVLKSHIGQSVTPELRDDLKSIITTVTMPRPMPFVATFIVTPAIVAPFRQWRALGAHELTHHVGHSAATLHGRGPWLRFCDTKNVENEYVLSQAEMVNCLSCLAREDQFFAPNTHLNEISG